MVLTLLNFSRREVVWYFRHFRRSPPKKQTRYYKEEDYVDPNISELIHLIVQTMELIRENHKGSQLTRPFNREIIHYKPMSHNLVFFFPSFFSAAIQQYYVSYIKGAHRTSIASIIGEVKSSGSFSSGINNMLDSILPTIDGLQEDGDVYGPPLQYDLTVSIKKRKTRKRLHNEFNNISISILFFFALVLKGFAHGLDPIYVIY